MGQWDDDVHLRLYYQFHSGTAAGRADVKIYSIDEAWTDSAVTWSTKPDTTLLYTYTNESDSGWQFHYFDVEDYLVTVAQGTNTTDFYGFMIFIDSTPYEPAGSGYNIKSLEDATYPAVLTFGYDEDDSYTPPDNNVEEITDFLVIFLILFFPALALGGGLATTTDGRKLAPIGFLVGLLAGAIIGVIVGIIPTWAIILLGIGLIILLWSMIKI